MKSDNKIDELFLIAAELDDAARTALLSGLDPAVREKLQALLDADNVLNGSGLDKTSVCSDAPDDDHLAENTVRPEAEIKKFLKPTSRPGWLGRLNHYEIEQVIGCGGFGIVVKAFDEKLHRVVAIKIMNPQLAITSPPRKRFLREARAAAAINHENIVAIHAVEEEPIPHIVMEFVAEQTLQQRLNQRGPLEPAEILRLGKQIAAGLAAAHAANLIHRDIKPANILLTGSPIDRVKISDFGLARAADDASLTASGMIAGSPMYMSPEQARGETLDHRSDLFSLGSVLYQMAAGRPPFRAAGTVAVLKRVCDDTPRALEDVLPGTPGWLETIVFKLLEKERSDRYQTAQEVADLLTRCLSELEHNGKVTCVESRSTAENANIPQAAKTNLTGTGASRRWLTWLLGGAVVIATMIGLLMMNGGVVLDIRDSSEVAQKTPLSKAGEALPSVDVADVTTSDSRIPGDREYFTQLQNLGADVSAWGLRGRMSASLKRAMKDMGNDNWMLVDSTSLDESPNLMRESSVFLLLQGETFDDAHLSQVVKLISRRPSDSPGVNIQIVGSSVTSNGVKALSAVPLNSLSLTDVHLDEDAVNAISRNKPIWNLIISNGGLSDRDVERLVENSTFSWLHIPGNQITRKSLGRISQTNVTVLNIGDNDLQDDDLMPLAANKKLTILYLSGNPVTDAGLQHLKQLPLTDLFLDRTEVTEASLKGFQQAVPGCRITWNNGQVLEPRTTGWQGWPADAPPPAIAPFDAEQAKQHQNAWAKYLDVPVEYTNGIGMKLRLIPPGEFLMGSTPEEIEAALKAAGEDQTWKERITSEGPRHKVIIPRPFYVGVTEVTQTQYEQVMKANPSHFSATGDGKDLVANIKTGDHPVEMVSWNDAVDFCTALSEHEHLRPSYFRSGETITQLNGSSYRLLNEAEWECGCRAGTTTRFWSGENDSDLENVGWHQSNSGSRTHAAAELRANPFGLYDIHGNVWEWILDSWETANTHHSSLVSPWISSMANRIDRPFPGNYRLYRGGSWQLTPSDLRSANRYALFSSGRAPDIGFRIMLSVDAVAETQAETISETKRTATSPFKWPADAPSPAIAPFDVDQATQHQEAWAKYLNVPVEDTNSIGMKFRLIPPAEFNMGTDESLAEFTISMAKTRATQDWWIPLFKSESPRHRVVLTRPIAVGINEVTSSQFAQFMKETSYVTDAMKADAMKADDTKTASADSSDQSSDIPVVHVSWNDAVAFCTWLSAKEGTVYRLPTEAEWEFACRAGHDGWHILEPGQSTPGEIRALDESFAYLLQYANVIDWSGAEGKKLVAEPVGKRKPNAFGLFDMHGNVWEWCQDGFTPYPESDAVDPLATSDSNGRILRGGAFVSDALECRPSTRFYRRTTDSRVYYGFRVVRELRTTP